MLRVEGLTKRYLPPPRWLRPLMRTATKGEVHALRSVSLTVDRGEILGLIGPNGAGKTTLIKTIATLLEPSDGSATVNGFDVVRSSQEARESLGLVLAEDRGVYWRLNGRQNLEFFGVLAGLPREAAQQRAGEVMKVVDLVDDEKLVFGYSSGMRARLQLGRALLAKPALLVLDEPTRSLDPLASTTMNKMLRGLADEGRAVLLASHRLDEVAAICDRIVILDAGMVRYEGPVEESEALRALLSREVER